MESIVREWITNLAVIAILAAMVDMILPSGNIRKYTSFLFGLVILAMFLHPLFELFGQVSSLETAIFQNSLGQARNSAAYYSSQAESSQKQNLEAFLKGNLEKSLAVELTYKTGLNIHNTSILFDRMDGDLDYSNVQRIDVYLSPHDQQVGISPVSIDLENESIDKSSVADSEKVLEIKKMVSGLYQIDPELVFVYEN